MDHAVVKRLRSQVGDRLALFGNVNPYDHLECMPDEDLAVVMARICGRRRSGRMGC